ncbi:MAG: hypothetical protein IJT05_01425 [Lachnospiraceae bacterium]|nr:hypothetical protein [Lachnospiraceae bacterium]MBQ7505964.1 hypothetical protein [Lachnospiraceae bacterium]
MAGRNHIRNRGSGGIDLNPLLDVIFIILLVVVCNTATQTLTTKEAAAEAEQMKEEAEMVRDVYEEQLDSLENMQDYVVPVALMVRFDSADVKNRKIEVLIGEKLTEIEITPQTEEEGYTELKELLSENLAGDDQRVMLLSLNKDDEQILYRDEVKVKEMTEELNEEFGNLFLK